MGTNGENRAGQWVSQPMILDELGLVPEYKKQTGKISGLFTHFHESGPSGPNALFQEGGLVLLVRDHT